MTISKKQRTKLKCEVCGQSYFSWTDLNGEVDCQNCGMTYQILREIDGRKPPFTTLKTEWINALREYHNETKNRCRMGHYLGAYGGMVEEQNSFLKWIDTHHPELKRDN